MRSNGRARTGALLAIGALAACTPTSKDVAPAHQSAEQAAEQSADAPPLVSATGTDGAATSSASAPPEPISVPAEASSAPSASASPSASSAPAIDPLVITLPKEPLTRDFSTGPFYFTAAFDGSLRYSLWLRTMAFSRRMAAAHQSAPHFTYFVNAAFFSTSPGKSDVGKAMSRAEVLVRRGLAQQAINEGHEVADHGCGHLDGKNFDKAAWHAEFDRFKNIMATSVFTPIQNEDGSFVFPRFEARKDAVAGSVGAQCKEDADCDSKQCLFPTPSTGLCTEPCNLKKKCAEGFACGAPMFRTDTDVCLPVPTFPIELDGQTLFDAKGEANFKHPRLKPYKIVGFRAPYLGANNALYDALFERGYVYDTSQSASPGPPFAFRDQARTKSILEFALIVHPGVLTIPMDYNYSQLEATPERMLKDYLAGVDNSLAKRVPFNVGHHFAMWQEGAYLGVLEKTVEYVLSGCPNESGEKRCAGAKSPSFRELAGVLLERQL